MCLSCIMRFSCLLTPVCQRLSYGDAREDSKLILTHTHTHTHTHIHLHLLSHFEPHGMLSISMLQRHVPVLLQTPRLKITHTYTHTHTHSSRYISPGWTRA